MNGIRYYIPPVFWIGVICILSSGSCGSNTTILIIKWLTGLFGVSLNAYQLDICNVIVRKAAHLTTYAVLAALFYRAFTLGSDIIHPRAFRLSLIFSTIVASLDEYHQSFVACRTGTYKDVVVDFIGAAAALVLIGLYNNTNRRAFKRRTETPAGL